MSEKCPCGRDEDYSVCCGPRLSGVAPAPSAEALMRSRYTAYVRQNADYLVATASQPAQDQYGANAGGKLCRDNWQGLTINAVRDGDSSDEAYVTFFARYVSNGRHYAICECSRFLREDQRWYYVDGIWQEPGRNDRCPCGSGKKYKKCCGQ